MPSISKAVDDVRAGIEHEVQTRPWLDHLIRAAGRFQRCRGDYYAAGITYFTVLALFPLLMVAFSVAGYILAAQPEVLTRIHDQIVSHVPGSMGGQITELVDRAVGSRTGVGVFGLLGALYTGSGWMANLRAALTEQWEQKREPAAWWKTKLSDLWALFGLLLALTVTLGLSAASSGDIGGWLLDKVGLDHLWGASILLRVASILLALLASWVLFTWMIARLPREPLTFVSAMRAGALAALAFEAFKQVASLYLSSVLRSPAGAVFGSIVGIMVFFYFTYRIVLFATAWAATAVENMAMAPVQPPEPAVITPRMHVRTGPTAVETIGLVGAGALAALGLSSLRRRR